MSNKRSARGPSQRQLRVGEELRHALAEVLRRGDFRDPELQNLNVTVTEVRISPDLRNATAFITPLGGGQVEETVAAMRRAAAFFRAQIARAIKLRYVPTLSFEADTSFEYADHINRLLHDPEVARDLGSDDDADDEDEDDETVGTHNGTHTGMNGDGPGHEEAEYEEEDDLDDEEDDEEDDPEYEEDDDEDEDDEDEEEAEYEEDEPNDGDKPAPLSLRRAEATVARKRKGTPIHGWLVIDKPPGMTSTQVMARVRRLLNAEKAGHGGTLDPIATGVLPIAFGEATKTVAYAMDGTKTYRFRLRWGEQTTTDDLEGSVIATSDRRPSEDEIEVALEAFQGEISQVPPQFSAIKVDGERAYDLARAGETVELASRIVRIDGFHLIGLPDADHADFEVECGKGTYMRSLARDLALALGTVGHITRLRRLNVGSFTLEKAISLDDLAALEQGAAVERLLLPIETALDDIPAFALTEAEAHRLRLGQTVAPLRRQDRERLESLDYDPSGDGAVVLAVSGGKPVALAKVEGGEIRPVRVLNL